MLSFLEQLVRSTPFNNVNFSLEDGRFHFPSALALPLRRWWFYNVHCSGRPSVTFAKFFFVLLRQSDLVPVGYQHSTFCLVGMEGIQKLETFQMYWPRRMLEILGWNFVFSTLSSEIELNWAELYFIRRLICLIMRNKSNFKFLNSKSDFHFKFCSSWVYVERVELGERILHCKPNLHQLSMLWHWRRLNYYLCQSESGKFCNNWTKSALLWRRAFFCKQSSIWFPGGKLSAYIGYWWSVGSHDATCSFNCNKLIW